MTQNVEADLWDRLSQSRRGSLDPVWLGEIYSPGLSHDLRITISEKLGMMAGRGWPIIKHLLADHGSQKELILAAGLCHQLEARDWLISQLNANDDEFTQTTLEALACWGSDIPENIIRQCLNHPSQKRRLAGLQLLTFRAHRLSDNKILELCDAPLNDFREPVVIATIQLLQRRDGETITNQLAKLCYHGSDAVSKASLLALGCIATTASQEQLQQLSQRLQQPNRREEAMKQLKYQFRNH